MCDFSLQAMNSRPARVGDKLVTHNFGTGTSGFRGAEDTADGAMCTAVCVMPGTEIGFEEIVKTRMSFLVDVFKDRPTSAVAVFRQIKKDEACAHHDALEFPDGQVVTLTSLEAGQKATVLQLPAAPKNETEAQEQKRLEVVG